jgi:beta-phosphoglucomutase
VNDHFKGALFDLDGVLVDTARYHYLAWRRLANELGFEFSEADNERLKGVSRMRSLEILLETGHLVVDEPDKLEMATKKNNWYVEYISNIDESELLPGAKEYLQQLKKEQLKIGLGSASKNALLIVNNLKISHLFDAIIDGNKVTKAKPDPEVFLLGARELGVAAGDCVVFEDAIAGIEAAKRAGMKTVGIGKKDVLTEADDVIDGLWVLVKG